MRMKEEQEEKQQADRLYRRLLPLDNRAPAVLNYTTAQQPLRRAASRTELQRQGLYRWTAGTCVDEGWASRGCIRASTCSMDPDTAMDTTAGDSSIASSLRKVGREVGQYLPVVSAR